MEVVYEPHKTLPLAEFHSELLFEFPDIPSALFDYYLLKAARKMAKDGKFIRRRVVLFTQRCVTRYRLNSPDGQEICAILGIHASHCGDCVPHPVSRSFDPPCTAHCCGRERVWYDDKDSELHFHNPFFPATYYISMAVCPSRSACELPAEYLNDHLETLLTGTKAYILMLTGRPWTNLQLGNAYLKEFSTAIANEAIEVHTHKQRGSIRMNFGRAL